MSNKDANRRMMLKMNNKAYRIKKGISENPKNSIFNKLGYNFNALQGGYISKDLSTIIITHRGKGHSIVTLYSANQQKRFKKHIQILKENNLLE
ncbi:hypothetical protein AB4Y30_01620 [Ornithinibacillus sp. 4-3]|uniref:Uncharacterized protein n=1 Tax=Ornithinibacillus sp. 4-3 TaxID=3231488 RepID=A0AB39HRV2_9BACI